MKVGKCGILPHVKSWWVYKEWTKLIFDLFLFTLLRIENEAWLIKSLFSFAGNSSPSSKAAQRLMFIKSPWGFPCAICLGADPLLIDICLFGAAHLSALEISQVFLAFSVSTLVFKIILKQTGLMILHFILIEFVSLVVRKSFINLLKPMFCLTDFVLQR